MARIRSIHPGLFTDEDYMALSPYAMAAWPGMWVESDDNGIFEWKPLTLKARLLPCAAIDMGRILAEYEERGLVRQFEVAGKNYGAIRNFRKFQRPEKPKAWHPLPDEMRSYVGLSPVDQQPIGDRSTTDHRKPPQMEDVGGKREKKEVAEPETVESGPRSLRSPSRYAFEGTIIRLTQADLDRWIAAYPSYPDMRAELTTIDAKLVDEGYRPADKWFGRVSGWLKKGHERNLAEGRTGAPEGDPFAEEALWRSVVREFVETRNDATGRYRGGGYWPSNRGVPPGRAGCRAPKALLAEFGLLEMAEDGEAA